MVNSILAAIAALAATVGVILAILWRARDQRPWFYLDRYQGENWLDEDIGRQINMLSLNINNPTHGRIQVTAVIGNKNRVEVIFPNDSHLDIEQQVKIYETNIRKYSVRPKSHFSIPICLGDELGDFHLDVKWENHGQIWRGVHQFDLAYSENELRNMMELPSRNSKD